ncbi:hypothetical protein NDU88_003648 [Pleurodeles waltl]|uniref:Uncharacterized protein n=1 Tax=Pleurodeles waltl TaxID=8319 RepID=A0AAV7W6U3_PLEWA|nr:hypothetical protein NDU88_003648 [Pleurodeles waltl]
MASSVRARCREGGRGGPRLFPEACGRLRWCNWGAARRLGRVAAPRGTWFLRRRYCGGTAGPHGTCEIRPFGRVRNWPGRRRAGEVRPLLGGIRGLSLLSLVSGGEPPGAAG